LVELLWPRRLSNGGTDLANSDIEATANGAVGGVKASGTGHPDLLSLLHLPHYKHDHPPVRNANEVHADQLSPLEKLAAKITDKVGSMGFFFIIFGWTVIWTGYNILASEIPVLHWKAFDPFPAFVAYLLISNVIQILLMPLIMVGQNVQARHSEIRAELDFEINQKAEKEVMVVLHHLEHNTKLILHLMKHLECKVTEEEVRAITMEGELAARIAALQPKADGAPMADR
jgi:uncharacterized membrane protein